MLKINLNTDYVVPYTFGLLEWSLVALIVICAVGGYFVM